MTQEPKGQEKPKTAEERLGALEEAIGTILDLVEGLTKKVTEVDKRAVKKSTGLFGGKRTKTAIKDTKTGKIYPSKANLGKKLAGNDEFKDVDPANNFAYYQIIAKAPDRFVDASEEEAEKVWAEDKIARDKEVAEANAKLEAEEKAKAAEEARVAAAAKAKAGKSK